MTKYVIEISILKEELRLEIISKIQEIQNNFVDYLQFTVKEIE